MSLCYLDGIILNVLVKIPLFSGYSLESPQGPHVFSTIGSSKRALLLRFIRTWSLPPSPPVPTVMKSRRTPPSHRQLLITSDNCKILPNFPVRAKNKTELWGSPCCDGMWQAECEKQDPEPRVCQINWRMTLLLLDPSGLLNLSSQFTVEIF